MTLDHYRNLPMPLDIAFSGGRTSGYMLCQFVEANQGLPKDTVVHFCNTGFELPETLDFVANVERHLGIKVNWLEFNSKAPLGFVEVNHNSASRKGEPFIDLYTCTVPKRRDGTSGLRPLPNPVQRSCTANLKVRTAHRFMKHLGYAGDYYALVGFRADESERATRRKKVEIKDKQGGISLFPMVEAGVTVDDIFAFWDAMPFDLGINSWEGNCDFCFMKSTQKIKDMIVKYPDRLIPWLGLEIMPRDRSRKFRQDRPTLFELAEEVMLGDMSCDPQDPDLMCNGCTG